MCNTVDRERFAGLNIHGFNAIEVFMEIFSRCLGHKYSLFSIIKERYLYSQKNFYSTSENRENAKVWPREYFPVYSIYSVITEVYVLLEYIYELSLLSSVTEILPFPVVVSDALPQLVSSHH